MRTLATVVLLVVGAVVPAASQTHVVIVSGVGGDADRRERFYALGRSLVDASRDRFGIPPSQVIYLAEKMDRDPERIQGRSTKAQVQRVLNELAGRAGAMDQIVIVLIGHGSHRGDESYFNVPGPDLSAADFASLLEQFSTQRIAFVNAASASGDFISKLSGPNRTILTATKSGFERNETLFGEFFVRALASDVADTDKDDRLSMLEAFIYARREVVRVYEEDGRLLTEHAMLDDNGDGKGTDEPGAQAADGSMARMFFLTSSHAPSTVASDDPELRRLYERKSDLERQIAELRTKKDSMAPDAYDVELERILVELARTSQRIRAREGNP